MGGELAAATLDNYDLGRAHNAAARKLMAEARDACRAYVDQPRGWIFLYGPTGVGKSHLAAATARAIAARHDLTLAYISEPALFKFLREGWGQEGDESEDARLSLLQEADLLVIDDLYTEHRGKDSTWVDSKLVALTMPRHQFERLTIITSNVQVDDVDEPRLRSRIKGRTNPDYAGRNQRLLIRNADQREGGKR
jgi:DNA replication protein DnaC